MSYCGPVWISDYTYNGLYDRMVDVAKSTRVGKGGGPTSGSSGGPGASGAATTRLRSYHVAADGALSEGALVDVVAQSGVKSGIEMHYEDAAGRTIAVADAAYRRIDSLRSGLLLAAEPPNGAARRARRRARGSSARAERQL